MIRKIKRNKSTTIRKQILTPFITLITLVPLLIIISFNLAFQIYVDNTSRDELINTKTSAYSLMQAAISSGELKGSDSQQSNAEDKAQLLVLSALATSRLSGNTEFLLLYEGRIVYPKSLDSTAITDSIAGELNLASIPADGRIYVRKAEGVAYYLTAAGLDEYNDFPNVTMLFLTSTSSFEEMIIALNVYLLIAVLIITAVAVFIFLSMSKNISRPITYASMLAEKIGNGEFVAVPIDHSCDEIFQLTTSLNNMSQQLKEAESVQKKFIQNASHELRTPLMSIQGYAEGIEKSIVTDTISAATIIKLESIRMKKLVDELLTLSRIENQAGKVKLVKRDLNLMLPELIKGITGMAMQNNIELVTNIHPSELPVMLDESLLSQVILNVMSNCIHYAKSQVILSTNATEHSAVICIDDDGSGFCDEDIEHIFDRFYKGKGGNFGLGLAIASSAAKTMKSSISAANNESGGASFKIIFKLAK